MGIMENLGKAYDECDWNNEKAYRDIIVQAMAKILKWPMVNQASFNGLLLSEFETLARGQYIQCIKDFRNRTGVGLPEAKRLVDEYRKYLPNGGK